MNKKTGLLLLSLSATALLAIGLWRNTGTPPAAADAASVATLLSGGTAAANVPAHFVTGLESLPASLRDTEVDGELAVDAHGHLRISHGLRNTFDYFLAATGEEPMGSLLLRLRAYIGNKLPAGAAAEAGRILDGYIAYKKGLTALPGVTPNSSGELDLTAVRLQMQQVQALRTQYLSPEVITAFFGDEDALDRYTLARLDILQNQKLSAQARAQQLADIERQLPPALQESMQTLNQYQNLTALTSEWRAHQGSPAELRQIRENLVGPEASDRLEILDRERAAWEQRMQAWFSERNALLGNRNLSDDDRAARLATLREQRFGSDERARVAALERIHDQG